MPRKAGVSTRDRHRTVIKRLSIEMTATEHKALKTLVKRVQAASGTSAPVTMRAVVLSALKALNDQLSGMSDEQLGEVWKRDHPEPTEEGEAQ